MRTAESFQARLWASWIPVLPPKEPRVRKDWRLGRYLLEPFVWLHRLLERFVPFEVLKSERHYLEEDQEGNGRSWEVQSADSDRAVQSSPEINSTLISSRPIASTRICNASLALLVRRSLTISGSIFRVVVYTTRTPDLPLRSNRTKPRIFGLEM